MVRHASDAQGGGKKTINERENSPSECERSTLYYFPLEIVVSDILVNRDTVDSLDICANVFSC